MLESVGNSTVVPGLGPEDGVNAAEIECGECDGDGDEDGPRGDVGSVKDTAAVDSLEEPVEGGSPRQTLDGPACKVNVSAPSGDESPESDTAASRTVPAGKSESHGRDESFVGPRER